MSKTRVMEYKIEHDTIMDIVKEEISRVASRSYSEDGSPLYDGLRLVSRDYDTLDRLLGDMFNTLVSRFRNFVAPGTLCTDEVVFNLPDLSDNDYITSLLDRFLSMGIVGKWLQEKGNGESAMYLERANAILGEAELLMMTRMPVQRRTR